MKSAYTIAALEAKADRVLAWREALEESLPALAQMGYEGIELMVRGPEQFDVKAWICMEIDQKPDPRNAAQAAIAGFQRFAQRGKANA